MTFSAKTKRLGYGTNIKGVIGKNGEIVFAYNGRDGIVRIKKLTKEGKSFSAKVIQELGKHACQPFDDGFVLSVQDTNTIGMMKLDY